MDSDGKADSERGEAITALADLPERALVDEPYLADVFGVTPRTIRRMVARCELPPPISVANRSVWMVGRLLSYLDAAAERAQREGEERAKKIRRLT